MKIKLEIEINEIQKAQLGEGNGIVDLNLHEQIDEEFEERMK